MKLEEIAVSLELAKELKEAGYEQDSLFSWVISRYDGKTYVLDYNDSCGLCSKSYHGNNAEKDIAAPTASELGEALLEFPYPATFITKWYEDGVYLDIQFSGGFKHKLKINRKRQNIKRKINKFQLTNLDNLPKTEVDARAKMWLYLKQNNLINKEK